MRLFLVSTVLLALGVGAVRGGEPDQEVICVSQRSKVISLFRVNLQTGDAKNLTPEKGPVAFPSLSSDGKRIVFAASWDGGQNLYVTDAHGRNPKRITKLSAEQFPTLATWSPDGTKIAYMRGFLNRDPEVVVVDADGTNEKVLGDNLGEPSWSPDGKKIAVVTRIGGAFRLGVIDPDGKNLKVFETGAKNTRGQVHPCWAPDGKRIAFSDVIDGAQQIFVCDADGGNVKRVTNIPPDCTSPSWTPDGKRIAFAGHQAKMMGLFFIRPDGTGLEQIDATQLTPSVHTGRIYFLPPTPNPTTKVRELTHDPKQGGRATAGKSFEVCTTREQLEQKLGKAKAAELWKQIDPKSESVVIVGYGDTGFDPAKETFDVRLADAGGVPVALFKYRHTGTGVVQAGAAGSEGRFKVFAVPAETAAGWDRE